MEAKPLLARCRPLAQPALSVYQAAELEQLLKVLAERQRLRILNRLVQAKGEPLSVGEFVQALRLTQPTVSYHLNLLREVGLLEREARATSAYYRLAPAAFERIAALLALPPALAGREPAGASASEAR